MATEDNKEDMKEEVPEIAAFDPTKKKKKKKVTIVLPEEQEEKLVDKTENMSVSDALDPSFVGLKKKKKKPAAPNTFSDDDGGEGGEERVQDQFKKTMKGRELTYNSSSLVTLGMGVIEIIPMTSLSRGLKVSFMRITLYLLEIEKGQCSRHCKCSMKGLRRQYMSTSLILAR